MGKTIPPNVICVYLCARLSASFLGDGRSNVSETLSAEDQVYMFVRRSVVPIPRVKGQVKFEVASIGPKLCKSTN